jgi:hypothetical protein
LFESFSLVQVAPFLLSFHRADTDQNKRFRVSSPVIPRTQMRISSIRKFTRSQRATSQLNWSWIPLVFQISQIRDVTMRSTICPFNTSILEQTIYHHKCDSILMLWEHFVRHLPLSSTSTPSGNIWMIAAFDALLLRNFSHASLLSLPGNKYVIGFNIAVPLISTLVLSTTCFLGFVFSESWHHFDP